MLDLLNGFVQELRNAGLPVSILSSLDVPAFEVLDDSELLAQQRIPLDTGSLLKLSPAVHAWLDGEPVAESSPSGADGEVLLWTKISEEADPATRITLLKQGQRYLAENAVHGFLFQLPLLGVFKQGVTGFPASQAVLFTPLARVRKE